MRSVLASLVLLANVAASEPALHAQTGTIRAQVDRAAELRAVSAVNRKSHQTWQAEIDAAQGEFEISGLPLDARFDLIVDCQAGDQPYRLEGVDLSVPPSDYEEEQPLADEDMSTIRAKLARTNKFEDIVQVGAIRGNIQHAAVLLNKLRTRPFYQSKPGEVIWRVELWHFERPEDTWVKVQDELFLTIYRQRMPGKEYERKSLTVDPALGGIVLSAQAREIDLGRIALPQPERGVFVREADGTSRNIAEGVLTAEDVARSRDEVDESEVDENDDRAAPESDVDQSDEIESPEAREQEQDR